MPSNLSHCLSGIAVCGGLSLVLGLPPISTAVFFGGFVSMFVNIDYSKKTKLNRTPWGHSLYSAALWPLTFASLMSVSLALGVVDWNIASELSLVFSLAYWTHLTADFFTNEGLYVFKKGRWLRVNCGAFGIEAREEANALLNIYLCIPSAVAVMVLVGITG